MTAQTINFLDGTDPADPGAGRTRLYSKAGQLWYYPGAGAPKQLGLIQPATYAYPSNPSLAVNNITANHVAETRVLAAGSLVADQILVARINGTITGNNGAKNLLVGLDFDLSNALTATFGAGQTGDFLLEAELFVQHTGNAHILKSRCDFGAQYAFARARGTCTINVATTASNLVTQAWVANAADTILLDSIEWRLKGNGL